MQKANIGKLEYDLVFEERFEASQLHAFQQYLASIVQDLYDLNLPRIATVHARVRIISEAIYPPELRPSRPSL